MPTHYLKASFVHNMIRRIMGDSLFLSFYHAYATRFDKKKVTSNDFQKLAEEVSKRNLSWFFDQWVRGKGIPRMKIYNVKTDQQDGKWITRGRVRIIGYQKFTTYVDVALISPSETLTTRVWLGTDSAGAYHNDVPFETVSSEKPTTAVLDPDGDVLKYRKLPVKFGDLRQPADGIMIVGTKKNASFLLQQARHDSSQMDNGGWYIKIKPDNAVTLADLQQERVFLYGTSEENSVVAEQQGKFPYFVRNDTAFVKGEEITDSSLALLQIIENPFIEGGLLCWIAPLSATSELELLPYDHSWTIVRKKEEIASGVWETRDEDTSISIK